MKTIANVAGLCVAATALAACGGGGGSSTNNPKVSSAAKFVNGATFTMSLTADPGNLDPQLSAANAVFQTTSFGYDTLIHIDKEGKLSPQLATSWKASGTTATLELRPGNTCTDGSPFTAEDAAANINFVGEAKNKSPLLGTYVPPGATATASGSTVTVKLKTPVPFLLEGLADVYMVCKKGMADRKKLANKTDGTGLYALTEDVAGDHVGYTKRAGYTSGPGGVTSDTKGLPEKVVVKFVSNETTAANLLLSGGLNASTILGPDGKRLQAANLFVSKGTSLTGEMWFNQAAKRPGSDPAVRKALTQAVDLPQLDKVLTSGDGTAATTLAVAAPVACPGNSVAKALPQHGLDQAKATLDAAGWKAGSDGTRSKDGTPLALTFLYITGSGSSGSAATELAASTWKQLGAKVTTQAKSDPQVIQTVLGGSGNWDITWLQVNVSSPDQLVPFLSGPTPTAGNNFAGIKNAAYDAGMAKASKLQGAAGCSDWLAAESELVKDADVIPFANNAIKTFGKGAQFDFGFNAVVPSTVRMLAS